METITTDSKTPAHASNVYLFKNGYGMIVKTFELPPNDNSVEILDLPSNPVHGTFWIQSSSNKTAINSIRTKKAQKFIEKECSTVEDVIEANVGQRVELLLGGLGQKYDDWISGKIKSVKRNRNVTDNDDVNDEEAQSTTNGTRFAATGATFSSSGIQTESLALFETTDNGSLALPLSYVKLIRGTALKATYQRKIFKNCLSIKYTNKTGSTDMGLMKYLTFGITWAPSYNLTLLNSQDPSIKRLRLSSKAVILNDIENMNVDNLFCIVGFPNISKFASVPDPIISGEDVQSFLNSLNKSESSSSTRNRYNNMSVMANSVVTQQIAMPSFSSDNFGSIDTQQDSKQDSNSDDLHLYEFKKVSLQKKERLTLPIFDIEIPYKDIYHCKINQSQSEYIYPGYDEKKPFEEVWHSVEFENLSNFVWTTAPIVITKGQEEQQFIAQDTLTYTLKGSTTFVNLTKALDVRVQIEEKVAQTNPKRFSLFRVNYQTDTIEGKITLLNYKSEEVVVVISTTLMGKMTNYTVAPKKDIIKTNENVANQHHDIRWEINVKPKQTVDVTYVREYNKRV